MSAISIEDVREIYEICSTHYFSGLNKQKLAVSLLMMKIRNFSKEDVITILAENEIPLEKKEIKKSTYKWKWEGKYMKEISAEDFQIAVLDNIKVPVIVDFWAPWCGPCKAQAPLLEQLAREHQDKAHFYSVNVEDNAYLANEYNITSLPTLIIFKDGKLVERLIGLQSKNAVLDKIK